MLVSISMSVIPSENSASAAVLYFSDSLQLQGLQGGFLFNYCYYLFYWLFSCFYFSSTVQKLGGERFSKLLYEAEIGDVSCSFFMPQHCNPAVEDPVPQNKLQEDLLNDCVGQDLGREDLPISPQVFLFTFFKNEDEFRGNTAVRESLFQKLR